MIHDIAHCAFESCPAKDRCRRFEAHLEAMARGLQYYNYLMLIEDTKQRAMRNGSCIHYLNKD